MGMKKPSGNVSSFQQVYAFEKELLDKIKILCDQLLTLRLFRVKSKMFLLTLRSRGDTSRSTAFMNGRILVRVKGFSILRDLSYEVRCEPLRVSNRKLMWMLMDDEIGIPIGSIVAVQPVRNASDMPKTFIRT